MSVIIPKQIGTESGKILFNKSEEIKDFNEAKKIAESLEQTIDYYKEGSVGLAAPQIGISKRVFAINIEAHKQIYINPKILNTSSEVNKESEGCLSVFYATFFGEVNRPNFIKIEYYDINGEKHIDEVEDVFLSRVIQHELDHLNGTIFLQRMEKEDFKNILWNEELDIRKKY